MIIYKLGKHIKTAFVGIFRNVWMSFSAATAVAITLLLVALFSVLTLNVNSFMSSIEEKITIRAMVDNGYDQSKIYDSKTQKDYLGDQIRAIPGVATVTFVHKDDEFDRYIKLNEKNSSIYERFKDKNPMLHVYKVTLDNDNDDYEGISKLIDNLDGIKSVNYGTGGIHKLIDVFNQVGSILLFFMAALILLAIFLISNTIKLTIYNRKTEIQIMRLVGASNSYIRFPFILEGVIIGIFGAVVPAALTILIYSKLMETYTDGFMISSSLQFVPMQQVWLIAFGLLGLGAVVGMLGSLLSVGRYLKV